MTVLPSHNRPSNAKKSVCSSCDGYGRALVCIFAFLSGLSCASNPSMANQDPAPSFPGAVGWGADTVGGRGGRVLVVTSLADSVNNPPTGTLRWALQQPERRMIVFAVGGVIRLQGPLIIGDAKSVDGRSFGGVTVAGQSAPFPGITITGSSVNIRDTEQVILRHLRIRPGLVTFVGTPDASACRFSPQEQSTFKILDGLGIARSQNIMIDHCSITWATDELTAISDGTARAPEDAGSDRVTIQNCLIAECFDTWHWDSSSGGFTKNHDSGALLIWNCNQLNATVWGSTLWSNERRSPLYQPRADRAAHCRLDLCGNVIGTSDGEGAIDVDIRGNFDVIFDIDIIGNVFTTSRFYKRADQPLEDTFARVYWGSNNRTRGGAVVSYPTAPQGDLTGAFRATDRASYSPNWVTSTSNTWSTAALGGKVGAIRPAVDAIDARIHADVRAQRVAVPNTLAVARRFMDDLLLLPGENSPSRHPPGWDVDLDGMSDAWERFYSVSSPSNDTDGDGYSDLEEFLNETNPRVADR